jgi:hypothetical protein
MSTWGSDSRLPSRGVALITDGMDKKGENGGKGDQAGFYQIRVYHTQDNIEKDKLIYVPDPQAGHAHQKYGQFLPRQKGSIVNVQFDDMHQMSGSITGGMGSAGKGTGGGTVDGATGVDNETNSHPQYARGDVKQPTSTGWSQSETEEYRKDSAGYYKDIDTFRSKKIKDGKRMTAAYGDKTLSADQSYA